MHPLRKLLLVLAVLLLPGLLFAAAFDMGIIRVVGSAKPIKQILTESGIYGSIVPGLLEQTKQVSGTNGEISLTDPAIKSLAEGSFNPKLVQDSSEKAIDGIYRWLNGKSNEPDFNIDLSDAKNNFAAKVGEVAKARAASLPVCALRSLPTSTDPLSIDCLPRGLSAAQIGTQVQNDILHAEGFLENPHITASSIKAANSNQSVFSDQLKLLPQNYRKAKTTPFILLLFTILVAVSVIFLSTSKRKGAKVLGVILLVSGVSLLIFAWGLNQVVSDKLAPSIKFDNQVLQSRARIVVSDIVQSVDKNYWSFGAVYIALGAGALAATKFIHRSGASTSSINKHSFKP